MALPENKRHWTLGHDFVRQKLQTALQLDIRPDILTNHVRYSEGIDAMMPKAKYLTIIRDPVEQFISSFYYYHKSSSVLKSLPCSEEGLIQFLKNPQLYQKECLKTLINNSLYKKMYKKKRIFQTHQRKE